MAERVVSVKMPTTLVTALDERRRQDHYLDLSEQIRSVVRRKCLELTNPYTEGIRKLKKDIQDQAATQTAKEQIVQDILKTLQEGQR